MTLPALRHGPWRLTDLQAVPKIGRTVFSCFHCAGGSTMGYKLAGFDVLGGVEIDPKIMQVYRANHAPRHSYLMGVADFNNIANAELPSELFNLDILDGSPPCSSFSTNGLREKTWGKLKIFREGQAVQILDDLFGHFLITANKLRPKVVIAENVKGMLLGNARGYVREIIKGFSEIGYKAQLFLLDAAQMGVPQKRERVFFIAYKTQQPIRLSFCEPQQSLHSAIGNVCVPNPKLASPLMRRNWASVPPGKMFSSSRQWRYLGYTRCHPAKPCTTLTASGTAYHWSSPRKFQGLEVNRIQTFPDDFNFLNQDPTYICGMSVPPYMMQRVAREIAVQLLSAS
jgi:DNA (cytosine-5)-methyltransferase 1